MKISQKGKEKDWKEYLKEEFNAEESDKSDKKMGILHSIKVSTIRKLKKFLYIFKRDLYLLV